MTIDLETLKDPDKAAELQGNIDVVTAGQMLQDARIASGISVQEVCNHIHLKLSVINNIEQSVADKQISSTFMRGYIRCYARYLKISEDEVITAYDGQNVACEQQTELQSFSCRTKLEAHDNRLMLVSYGIIGFMLAVFLIWGLGDDVDVDVVVPEPIITQTIESVGAVTVIEEQAPLVVAESPEFDSTEFESTELDSTVAQTPALDVIAPPSSEVVPAEVLALVTALPTITSPVVTNTPDNKPAIVAQSLVLTFAGDCWIQVKDKNGKTLSTGVRKAGQSISLQGLAPLSIKLGAPEYVTMSYAGESVDLSTFKQGKLAKFKVPFEA
ncbi:MAG: helix-turn-helix domain-containing protein [Moritella sp.]|nr:MAG: helix-turn-helix domain-containing protein [Moritella sp.]